MKSRYKLALTVVAVFRVIAVCIGFAARSFTDVNRPRRPSSSLPRSQPQVDMDGYMQAVSDYEQNGLKGVWISYLEFLNMDFSSRENFRGNIQQAFSNSKNIGLNTVIVHVRPFGDAFYRSSFFPMSHIITGRQGADPGYDPLAIMVEEAHKAGLRIEAWVNPYRVKLGSLPSALSADNPALNEDLVIHIGDDIYYNPALEEVKDLVTQGVVEIVSNYQVDGIHFDDYFYPSTDEDIDSRQYRRYEGSLSLADWRRENVNTLIKQVYAAVKQANSRCVFGISPQGNNDNNYDSQYSDVKLWLNSRGYADYIMPQLYWGFNYETASGSDRYAFNNISREWAAYPRNRDVKLYIGLAAYRIGDGDGSASDKSLEEWNSGDNLSKMIAIVKDSKDMSGYCLYRYDNLFVYGAYSRLQQAETAAVAKVNRE